MDERVCVCVYGVCWELGACKQLYDLENRKGGGGVGDDNEHDYRDTDKAPWVSEPSMPL